MTELERIVRELADTDPACEDSENPTECYFCSARYTLYEGPDEIDVTHEEGCLWLRARTWCESDS